ncbi:MAG: flagellar motor switch protein FliG [Rhodobacteraceae bacterium]|nr:MAG: flagellar motor switch protein FliG [Paracoccaceae bacterium]
MTCQGRGMVSMDNQLMVSNFGGDDGFGTGLPDNARFPSALSSISTGNADTSHLTGAQKAAIIVRLLVAEGVDTPISSLPEHLQALLTQTLGTMGLIDRKTMCAVVDEFVEILDQIGLSFPDGLDAALELLDGRLDAGATQRLRALARGAGQNDAWSVLENADIEELQQLIAQESLVVGAVLLSKLSTDKAAKLLMKLPSDQAKALAIAVAHTETVAPDTVARVGATLAEQISCKPARAFALPPAKRMGEILNASPASARDQLLRELDAADKDYANGIRKSIFTYQDIPARLSERDVPTLMRELTNEDLMLILAAGKAEDTNTNEFLLGNMSKRLAESLREDSTALPAPDQDSYEAALSRIAGTVRRLADDGTIKLQVTKD